MRRSNFPTRRDQRRDEANRRAEKRNNRTPEEQLERLRKRGHGHCKEAQRLEALIEESK